jgi:hypothetical protein|nr:MAG TPA: Exopolysaccharide production repressor [Caudoviricetes sp.]
MKTPEAQRVVQQITDQWGYFLLILFLIFFFNSNFKNIKVSVIRYKIEETSVSSMFFSVTDVLQISKKKRPPPVVAHRKRSGETKPF